MQLAELQTRMRQTLLARGSPDSELLALLADPSPQRERRLAVYRNNVRHALLSVLDAAFPVIRELIGADCFSATALVFIAQRSPHIPALHAYGGELPDFLADFAPLAELPWLADVARLEWARNEALFAADREPLSPNQLATVPVAELPGLRLELHSSAWLHESPWPIHAIWDAHQPGGGALEAVDLARAEAVLVWRRSGTVHQRSPSPGEFALLAAFALECSLAEAAETAAARDPDFDLSAVLARLLADGVLTYPT